MVKKKRVFISVLNDLYTDPRVDKVCRFLLKQGFEVTLIGCRHKDSPRIEGRPYETRRLRMFSRKGPFFFAGFNVKLFFYLLFQSYDILVANDLDTLLPNFLNSRWKNKGLVYDSHELYCEMDTVTSKPLVRKVWNNIERFCFPKLSHVTTVSDSIARAYQEKYGVEVEVVRNIPSGKPPVVTATRSSLGLPEDKKIVIMQGNSMNKDRGAREILEAMPYIFNAVLLFVGKGEELEVLKSRASELGIKDRVFFVGRVLPDQLFNYTYLSDIGVSFDKNISLNHYYSLPNKLFEYIKAETPLVISNLPERAAIVRRYGVGLVVDDLTPQSIAQAINTMISDDFFYNECKTNCTIAANELTWENEEKVLAKIYQDFI